MAITDNLRERFDRLGGHARSGLDDAFTNAISYVTLSGEKRAELAQNKGLSPVGVAAEVRKFATKGVVGELKRHRRLIDEGRAEIEAKRARMKTPPIDKGDMLAAAHRKEARELLRSMPPAERAQVLFNEADPLMVSAALELPDRFSGLDASMRANLLRVQVEKRHGPEDAALAEREEALTALTSAVEIAEYQLRENGGLEPHQFKAWMDNPAAFEAAMLDRQAA